MESTIADINVEDSPRSKLEKIIDSLTHSITKKLDTLPGDSYTVCIYRISKKHIKINEEAYTPRLVSIGPLHHGKSQLQAMEGYKLRCVKSFKSRLGISMRKLVKYAAEEESYVRGCYEDTVQFSSEEFSEIILLDGIFIVELFLKNQSFRMRDPGDVIFENTWMSRDILHDMLLLENQLPISFIAGLFNFLEGSSYVQMSFLDYVCEYFKDVGNTERLRLTDNCSRARHFVELLVYLHQPSCERQGSIRSGKFEYTRSASELQEAGVKFNVGTGHSLFDVSFDVAVGALTIQRLKVNDLSETFFRNLIAFEQCGHHSKNITSYIIFMDSLIDTPKDVDLLIKHNIIENCLGESQQVADLFNNLYKEILPDQSQFYFAKICGDLDEYSKDYLHKWKSRWFRWKLLFMGLFTSDLFLSFLPELPFINRSYCSQVTVCRFCSPSGSTVHGRLHCSSIGTTVRGRNFSISICLHMIALLDGFSSAGCLFPTFYPQCFLQGENFVVKEITSYLYFCCTWFGALTTLSLGQVVCFRSFPIVPFRGRILFFI